MSYSNFSADAANSFWNPGSSVATTPTPSAQPQSPVPGTKDGITPTQTPAQETTVESIQTELDKFKLSDEDKKKYEDSQKFKTVELKPEQFSQIAQQVSSSVQVDETLREAALRGDADSMNKMLQKIVQDTMQASVFSSANIAQNLALQAAEQATQQATSRVTSSQAESATIQSVATQLPALNNAEGQKIIKSKYAELRAAYPTAPAELLGQQIVQTLSPMFQGSATPSTTQTEEPDWLAFSARA